MELIKCPACGHEVSDQATACPNCGQPLHPAVVQPSAPKSEDDVQTIQLTKKKWKKVQLWAVASIVVAITCFANHSASWGFFFLFVAFVLAITGNIGAWWSTG